MKAPAPRFSSLCNTEELHVSEVERIDDIATSAPTSFGGNAS